MIDKCRCIFRVILPLLNVVVVAATKEATTASGATILVTRHRSGCFVSSVWPGGDMCGTDADGHRDDQPRQWHHNIMARPSRHIL